MADDVIDSLQIQMTADVSRASRSITGLIGKLNSLNKTMSSIKGPKNLGSAFGSMRLHIPKLTTGFNQIGVAANKATVKMNGLSGAMTKSLLSAKALTAAARGLWRALSSGIELASDLVEVQNVVDKAFGNEAYKLQDLVQTSIQDLGMSELTAKQIASRYQAMGSAMGISGSAVKQASAQIGQLREGYNSAGESMADMSLNLTRLSADMASFYNVGIEEVAEDLNAVFTGQTRPLMLAA